MPEKSRWTKLTEEKPGHSAWYIQRFKDMAAEGRDLHGEARLVDAMASRGSRILDAGCGPGRVGGRLAELGHSVVGVDGDAILIAEAAKVFPDSTWVVADLAEMDLSAEEGEHPGVAEPFDVIVAAGNVMTFLADSTRREVLTRLASHLAPEGRLVVGFGGGRDYEFADFFDDAAAAGLTSELNLSTWDLRPHFDESDFLVAVLVAP